MGRLLITNDGKTHTLCREEDLFRMVEEYMGSEISEYLSDKYQEIKDELDGYNEAIEELKTDHKEMVKSVETSVKHLNKQMSQNDPDQEEIVNAIDEIEDAIHEDPWKWI